MSFSATLLKWYDAHKRSLPWRGISDPYKIWLSEIILQQTQIAQGKDYYLRFIERFPTVHDLASASEDEVMKMWEGLGYYSRARNLHYAARQIVERGDFPTELDDVRKLKGVGDYTAAAICSMAYNYPAATLDGNAYRVFGRIYSIEYPFDEQKGKAFYTSLANSLLDTARPGEFNQAIMDLGATICTPKNPHCDECPFCDSCGAHTAHQEHHFPIRAKKPEVKERFLHYFFILHDHRIVMHKRGDRDIWKSLYEPFLIETAQSADLTQLHHPWLTGILKSHCVIRQHGKNIRHVLTHRILRANFYSIYLNDLPAILPEDYRFVPTEELQWLALPALIKKHLDWISDYNTTET